MSRRILTKNIPGPCDCCTGPACQACPSGTVLPSSFDITLSGIVPGLYNYDVLNQTWRVTWDSTLLGWIYQTPNPPLLLPLGFWSRGSGLFSPYQLTTAGDAGTIAFVYCYHSESGLGWRLSIMLAVFDVQANTSTASTGLYTRVARWINYDAAISAPNACNPLYIEINDVTQSYFGGGYPGSGFVVSDTQSPVLILTP